MAAGTQYACCGQATALGHKGWCNYILVEAERGRADDNTVYRWPLGQLAKDGYVEVRFARPPTRKDFEAMRKVIALVDEFMAAEEFAEDAEDAASRRE